VEEQLREDLRVPRRWSEGLNVQLGDRVGKSLRKGNRRPTILIITPFFTGLQPWILEGGEPAGMPGVVNLLRNLRKSGFLVKWLIASRDSKLRKELEGMEVWVEPSPPAARFLGRLRPRRISKCLAFIPLLLFLLAKGVQIVRTQRVNIVYVGGSEGLQLLGSILARVMDLPNVSRIFGTPLVRHLEGSRPALKMMVAQPLDALSILAPCSLMVVTNDGTRGDRVARCLNAPKGGKLLFLTNGVDPREGRDQEAAIGHQGVPSTSKTAIWVSRFDHWKRVDLAIKAMGIVAHEDPDALLLIVGYGRREAELRDLVEKLHLEKRVLFLGRRPASEVRRLLSSSDLYVSAYDYHANVSNTLLEALSEGCCCVTLRDRCVERIITHAKNGFLVDEGQTEVALAEVMGQLLSNPLSTRKAGRRARLTARALGSWEGRMLREIDEIERLLPVEVVADRPILGESAEGFR